MQSGDARRGRGRAPAARRSDGAQSLPLIGAERRENRFLLCPPPVTQAAAQGRLIIASTATPPALATRFLRDTIRPNFCVDLVQPRNTTKTCRRSPTLGYEANRPLSAGALSRGCFSARCLHSPRGEEGSGARPGSPAFESKTKRGASCRVPRRLSLCIPSRGTALGGAPLRQPAPPDSAFPGLGWTLEEILQSYYVGLRGITFTEL